MAPCRPVAPSLALGHGVVITVSHPSGPGTLRLRLAFRGRTVVNRTFTGEGPQARIAVACKFFKADLTAVVDVFAGEVRIVMGVAVRRHAKAGTTAGWKPLFGARLVVFRFAPAAGQVAGSAVVHAPTVDDAVWGRSQLCTPAVLRLFVDESHRAGTPVGRLVKQVVFPDHPPFVFNTVACVGGVADGGPGLYSDPESHWFNVFLGYYQVDCDKRLWSRPFAYRAAAGAASAVEPDDILRLGMADWNWFSNWMYGVPSDVAMLYTSVGAEDVTITEPQLVGIGSSRWHQLRFSGVQTASCYQASAFGGRRLVRNSPLGAVWRRAFGLAHPRPQFPRSFVPTSLEAVCDLCYWEDDAAFHTVIFGASAAVGTDPGFIATQRAALHQVIERAYPTLGF